MNRLEIRAVGGKQNRKPSGRGRFEGDIEYCDRVHWVWDNDMWQEASSEAIARCKATETASWERDMANVLVTLNDALADAYETAARDYAALRKDHVRKEFKLGPFFQRMHEDQRHGIQDSQRMAERRAKRLRRRADIHRWAADSDADSDADADAKAVAAVVAEAEAVEVAKAIAAASAEADSDSDSDIAVLHRGRALRREWEDRVIDLV